MVFTSPKQYEIRTGKCFNTECSSIHKTGSIKGMIKLGYWSKTDDIVKSGEYIYNQTRI